MLPLIDVAVVGFGPAGQILASLLGRAGHRIVVFEKFAKPYGLPRMSTLDGEVARLLQHTCDPIRALHGAIPQPTVELFGVDGTLAATVDWSYERAGYPSHLSLHQPNLESAMIERIASFANVEVRWGREVVGIERARDGWLVTAQAPCGPEQVRARYLVGMDGAPSFVRRALGIELDVLHVHEERWILTDFDVVKPLPNGLNHRLYFDMNPAHIHYYGPNGEGRCRTDVRVEPGASVDAMMTDEFSYEFLEERVGIPSDHVKLTRRVLYQFRSQLARSFRLGRAFIGGDAAHSMTPYMAQGACTAMRDAANLAWKLDLVLSGKMEERLLDTYELERLPHAAEFVRGSLESWKMINMTDQVAAQQRDETLRGLGAIPAPVPGLSAGLLHRSADGTLGPQSGELAPQGRVRIRGRERLLDDLVGFGFQLLSTIELDGALDAERIERLDALGVHRATIGHTGPVVDIDGTYANYFATHGATTLCSRPDLYVFGIADGVKASVELVDSLLEALPFASKLTAIHR